MPRRTRYTRTSAALFVLATLVVALFAGATSAYAAAPVVTNAKFTGPVAYELKSLLTTRMTCNVDQAGTWGKLDILGANGVVKTIYNGPLVAGTNWLPIWNGLDAAGKQLPSASYDWRLTVSKSGASTVVNGKITVSKINFVVKGTLPYNTKTSAARYMIPGAANCYIHASTDNGARINAWFYIDLTSMNVRPGQTEPFPYMGAALSFPGGTTYTHYLRDPWIVQARGNRTLTIKNQSSSFTSGGSTMTFDMTVIQ